MVLSNGYFCRSTERSPLVLEVKGSSECVDLMCVETISCCRETEFPSGSICVLRPCNSPLLDMSVKSAGFMASVFPGLREML